MYFAFSAPGNQHLALCVCGWDPRLNSPPTSNFGLGCYALKELVKYGENIDTIFHNGGKTSSLAICVIKNLLHDGTGRLTCVG